MTRQQQILFLVFLIAAGAVAYFVYNDRPDNITNYPSSGTDIIAFGDSLVAGQGANKGNDFVSILSRSFNTNIINLGVDGDTTAEALARVGQFDNYKPKVVILLVGGNDYLKRLNMDDAFKNEAKIIEEIHKRGAVVVLVGVKLHPLLGNFDKQFGELASHYKTAYVPDILDGILGNPKLLSDNIHPNDQGYKLMAERIIPILERVVE